MAQTIKIIRRSIHAFLTSYQSFTAIATLLVLPFSGIVLISQSFNVSSSPLLQTISSRIHSIFQAAGFPATSQFFSLLNLKLSQTIFSFLFCLPFTLAFAIPAKASIIQIMLESRLRRVTFPSFKSLIRVYRLILPTHLFNKFVILSANAAVFSLLSIAFNALDIFCPSSDNCILVMSAAGAVLYSIVLANAAVACNLATVISAMENCRGYLPFLKACVFIQGKEATAITLALPANLGMAAMEALFQYRIARPYFMLGRFSVAAAGETLLTAYMYSLLIVLDTIISCTLYRDCKDAHEQLLQPDQEPKGDLQA